MSSGGVRPGRVSKPCTAETNASLPVGSRPHQPTRDDQPVIVCDTCGAPAMWWLRRADGIETLRCDRHGEAAITTEMRAIDCFDWRSMPDDPFTKDTP